MQKILFKDAFSDIEFDEEVSVYFDEVWVTDMTLVKNSNTLYISILSNHLIDWMYKKKAEEAVRLFAFGENSGYGTGNSNNKVVINDRYELSSQYSVESIMKMYGESILEELGEKQPVEYVLIKSAKSKIDENGITFEIPEGNISKTKKPVIEKYFNHIFEDKFGMDVCTTVKLIKREKKVQEEEVEEERTSSSLQSVRSERLAEMDKLVESAYDSETNAVVLPKNMIPKKATTERKKDYKAKSSGNVRKNFTDKECFYGRNVEGEIVRICDILESQPNVMVVRGEIVKIDTKEIRNEKTVVTAYVSDYTDTIAFKLFVKNDDLGIILDELSPGNKIMVKGTPDVDDFIHELVLSKVEGVKRINDFVQKRTDTAEEKRVELHLHTKYSDMNGVTPVEGALQNAIDWGHPAIGITDNAAVYGFTAATKYLGSTKQKKAIKLLFGIDANIVDDYKTLAMNPHGQSLDSEYVVFDIETTGLSYKFCKVIEIGAVRLDKTGSVISRFSEFVNPEEPIPYNIQKLTSITDAMVSKVDTIDKVLPRFLEYCKDAILVAHNASFDTNVIRIKTHELGLEYDFTALDTMTLAYVLLPELGRYNLDRLTHYFKLTNAHHHRACDDAEVTSEIFVRLLKMLNDKGIENVDALNELGRSSDDYINKARPYTGVIYAKNCIGRTNLYRMISQSHIKYFNRVPRIPMSMIQERREGLVLGSGSSTGHLYQALLDGEEEEDIERIVNFYDYLEIQPIANNLDLIDDDKVTRIKCEEDLRDINREIVKLGEKYGKPVVATGDVYFLNPEDAIYRAIIRASLKHKGLNAEKREALEKAAQEERAAKGEADKGVDLMKEAMAEEKPLYFRTTDEMLEEFSYLGEDKAREVVITNTNYIASWMDLDSPVRPDKAPPRIKDSDITLRKICYDKMHEMYGPTPPDVVKNRLDKELDSIIGNGYSVMYIVAQKLVWNSNDNGYLVGSRGSVGSSFAATMAGITEVNPLPAHYLCPNCFYTDFDSETIQMYKGECGCDMPDAVCPKCGHKLNKEGQDIPFETFLGFKGDKEPDIDLNFSGEYQAKAHAYVGEIFGRDHSFKAGTVGAVAEKTAILLAKDYCGYKGVKKKWAEIERLAKGCIDVKRTSGQHPGGIIVTPDDEEIHSFTPVQKPANDMSVDIITTHFDYHSIEHNLLKFDILGHEDPTMIRRLEDLTGVKVKDIPFDDPEVMELFKSTKPLGIDPDDIGGIPLGCLGVPEFGTEFAIQMLVDADPQSFSDLVRIAGLSHGTDVWLGNAQKLIQEGKCKLSSAICCRDDIMVYLLNQGLESGDAFTIMERVRKGLVAKGKCNEWPDFKEKMQAHDVPDWYIWSCEQIKYMFPKAHAVAYVMMSWRVAWYKIHYPLAYYAAYFSIRADAFSYEKMCQGKDTLNEALAELLARDKNSLTSTEANLVKVMKIVREMYARGFEFEPIDLYSAKADRFQIVGDKIMPSFQSLDKMGESAARQLEEAAKVGEFLSQEELKNRAKISGTVIEKMAELGLLGDMPKTSQLTFDFLS